MMKYLKNFLKKISMFISTLGQDRTYIKDLFIIIVITRLMFLEDNTLALLAEIVGGLVIIFHTSENREVE